MLRAAVVLLFFLSGASGLVYEVVWTRYLTLLLGHTARGNAVVLATFMGGLALGYRMAGALADRLAAAPRGPRRLLGAYALLEAGIGLYGAAFPWLMGAAGSLYVAAGARLSPDSAALLPLSLALAVVVLLPPTVLMGATLPVLVAWAAPRPVEAGAAVARLYAANSAGAVVGAAVAGFVLVEQLGQRGTLAAAAATSLALAAAAWWLRARAALQQAGPAEASLVGDAAMQQEGPGAAPVPRGLPEAVALGSGFAALLLEVVWIRLFAVVFGSSTQSFTAIVAAFVAGVALGAALARRLLAPRGLARRWRHGALGLLALAAVAAALLVVAAEPAYARLPWLLGRLRVAYGATHEFWRFQGAKFYLALAVMAPAAAMSGLLLPLAVALRARAPGRTGREAGGVLSWNAAGSVAGAALAGTVLVPRLSLPGTLLLGVAVLAGVGALGAAALPGAAPRRLARAALVVALVLPPAVLASRSWDPRLLSSGEFRRATEPPGWERWRAEQSSPELLFHQDGQVATVDVLALADGRRYLKVNAKTDASSWGDVQTAAGSPAVGALLSDAVVGGEARAGRGLVIGFGSGVTANTLLKFGLDVDLVEIEPAVLAAAPFFRELNDDCLRDPHLTTHVADARAFMQMGAASERAASDGSGRHDGGRDGRYDGRHDVRYDVIVNEPSNPWVAGVASLFTHEFFEAARARLADGGTFVQWFHLYDMDDDTVRLVLRTVSASFRFVTVWSFENDIAVVARTTPFASPVERLGERFDRPAVREYLGRVGIYDLAALLSTQLASEERAPLLSGPGPLHEDDLPTLEHHAPRAQFDRSYAFALASGDERLGYGSLSPLLLGGWARAHGGLSLDEAIHISLLQAAEPRSPEGFRFRWLDAAITGCRQPALLGRLALALDHAHRPVETDRALAALERLAPDDPRTALLAAQVRVRRLGPEARRDAAVADLLRRCAVGPAGPIHDACLQLGRALGARPD